MTVYEDINVLLDHMRRLRVMLVRGADDMDEASRLRRTLEAMHATGMTLEDLATGILITECPIWTLRLDHFEPDDTPSSTCVPLPVKERAEQRR